MSFLCDSAMVQAHHVQHPSIFRKISSRVTIKNTHDQRVLIRVRGARYETYKSTLDYFPKTLLGSEETRMKYYDRKTNELVFQTTPDIFDAVLFFYQSKGILARPNFSCPVTFWEQLRFFGLARPRIDRDSELPEVPWKRKMWLLLEHPEQSLQAKVVAYITMFLIIGSVGLFCIESVFRDTLNTPVKPNIWFYLDTSFMMCFTIEYILRLISAPHRLQFMKSMLGVIDLTCLLPYYCTLILLPFSQAVVGVRLFAVMRVFRLLQVSRILKLTRYSKDLRNFAQVLVKSSNQMAALMVMFMLGVVFCSSLLFIIENSHNEEFNSIPAVFWFAVVTMTTVGYGDLTPMTIPGRIASAITIFIGTVTMFYLFIPVYSMFFDEFNEDQNKDEFEIIPATELK